MILVGISPGPREPSLHMNSYLEPVVRELLQLWKGIEMVTPDGFKLCVLLYCEQHQIFQLREN